MFDVVTVNKINLLGHNGTNTHFLDLAAVVKT